MKLFFLLLIIPTFLFAQTGTWGVTHLPEPVTSIVGTTSLSKVFFLKPSTRKLFIFNSLTETWTSDSVPTELIPRSITSIGSKIFIVCDSGNFYNPSKRLHTFNQLTNTWSVSYLSFARKEMTYAKIGSKLYFIAGKYFGGGPQGSTNFPYPSNVIDIYDTLTNNWSVLNMPSPRFDHSSIGVQNTFFIAGGYTSYLSLTYGPVSYYNATNSNWSTYANSINSTRTNLAAIGNLVFLNYGFSNQNGMPTNNCEIFNITTNQWTTHLMTYSRSQPASATTCDHVFFGEGYNKYFDIYHFPSNSFYIDSLPINRSYSCIVSTNDKLLFAGGNSATDRVDVFYEQCTPISIDERDEQHQLSIFPNPCSNIINLENSFTIDQVEIFDMLGKEVQSIKNINSKQIEVNVSELKQGVYLFKISSENNFDFKKIHVINNN